MFLSFCFWNCFITIKSLRIHFLIHFPSSAAVFCASELVGWLLVDCCTKYGLIITCSIHALTCSFLVQFSPEKFAETLKLMEHRYGAKDFETSKDTSLLSPGTFYLTKVDSMYRRCYAKKGSEDAPGSKMFSFSSMSMVNGY